MNQPFGGAVSRVFISHAGEDLSCAEEVRGWLQDDGHHVFLDQSLHAGLPAGQPLVDGLLDELRRSDVVVAIVTEAFITSTWCSFEIGVALAQGCLLLPVYAAPDLVHEQLQALVRVDFHVNPAAARDQISAAVRRVDGGGSWRKGENPYPGLEPFDRRLARMFIGRQREAGELAKAIRSDAGVGRLLAVVGPSGCGKSSLLRAGVLPLLEAEGTWLVVPPVIPGGDPNAALIAKIVEAAKRAGVDQPEQTLKETLSEALASESGLGEVAEKILGGDPGRRRRRLLIVVDQAEELFAFPAEAEKREHFTRGREDFVRILATAKQGPVRVVVTLRKEFLDDLLALLSPADVQPDSFLLSPLTTPMLRQVIEEPARRAGIGIDAALVDRLTEDTGSGEALPQLAFTLHELAIGRLHGSSLSSDDYDGLGGVRDALARRADAALSTAIDRSGLGEREILDELMRLVTVDEAGRLGTRRLPRRGLPEDVQTALGVFVNHRLLINGGGDKQDGWVGVAHEAFPLAWPPTAKKIDEAGKSLRARRRVAEAAVEWDRAGRRRRLLLQDAVLARIRVDVGARFRY